MVRRRLRLSELGVPLIWNGGFAPLWMDVRGGLLALRWKQQSRGSRSALYLTNPPNETKKATPSGGDL
ncbi:MAG: hypothetical protein AAF514_00815 [Verrucomicrobiota bacterium]